MAREGPLPEFGLLIAFVLPGFIGVWGLSRLLPGLQDWIAVAPQSQPTLGGFLYVTVASIGAGLVASTIRWLLLDTLHHWTGLERQHWNFSRFHEVGPGYERLTELHYRFYLFYGNSLVALPFAWACARVGDQPPAWGLFDIGTLLLLPILYAGSRDTLEKYYSRLDDLLGPPAHTSEKTLLQEGNEVRQGRPESRADGP